MVRTQTEFALGSAIAALQAGKPDLGLKWLDRAARLAPDSPVVSFMLGVALARTDLAAALARFNSLIAAWPEFREAHFAIAGATLRISGAQAAAGKLSAALCRFRLPPHPDHHRVACEISGGVGAPGWISLAGDLVLTASLLPRPHPTVLEINQAGQRLHRRRLPAGSQRDIRVRLPDTARRHDGIHVTLDGLALLGSGLSPTTVLRVDALVVSAANGRLRGRATMPGAPDGRPSLTLRQAGTPDRIVSAKGKPKLVNGNPFSTYRAFSVPLVPTSPAHVLGPDGRDVPGSPVFPTPIPAPGLPPPRSGLDIIIPVFRDAQDLQDCLASLRTARRPGTRVVVVDDGSTDQALLDLLGRLAQDGTVILLRHARNRGYPAAINTGLRHAEGRDVLLLNADTLLPPGAVGRLRHAAYTAPNIGSVTPLSNEASIVSYPDREGGNPPPRGAALRWLDRLCQTANAGQVVDLPTGVGFCMYVRADCLAATGGFREDVFAQGYGEENEWCRRSASLGWRHVAATDVFVSHLGGRSFGPARIGLMARNGAVLNRLHPGYDALIQRFLKQDKLAEARRRLDMARWQRAGTGKLVLLVSHDLGGGVKRFVDQRCEDLRAAGRRVLVVQPGGHGTILLKAGLPAEKTAQDYLNLRFHLPADWQVLLSWLGGQQVERVELQHYLNHAPGVETLAQRLRVPFHIYVHDNIFFCPRLTLVGRSGRYCGEPVDTAVCDACVAELGSSIASAPPVAILRAQSRALFHAADEVVVPCQDVARRVRRYTGVIPVIRPWEDDTALPPRRASPNQKLRVVVVGALNQDKGLEVLRDCASAATAGGLQIEFVLIGFSEDDEVLIQAGVFVTGKFAPAELPSLLQRERPGLGFIPSVVPETWCYALTAMWQAGLDVLGFDLGAQAERIRATGRGRVIPPGVPPDRVLMTLIAMQSARR